jgi:hypothetical protein
MVEDIKQNGISKITLLEFQNSLAGKLSTIEFHGE